MKKGGLFGILFFGLFWTALVGTFDTFIFYNQFRQIRATTFPQTAGTVTRSEVTSHSGSKGGTTYGVKIEYTYHVNGAMFEGARYRYNEGSSSDSQWAHDAVRNNPVGASVPVFYNSKDPSDALLRPGTNGGDLFMFLFLTPFNMIMLGLWAAAFGAIRGKCRQPVAGGVKRIDDGQLIRVRLPRFSPIITFLGTIGLGSFFSIFIIGFSAGFHPGVRTVLITWAVLLVGGGAFALWVYAKHARGNCDLVIDRAGRTVQLPLTFGRKQRPTIPFSALTNINVETIEHRGSKGRTTYSYAVTLQRRDDRNEKLTDWYDEPRANSLATWLRERIPFGESEAPPRKIKNVEQMTDSNPA